MPERLFHIIYYSAFCAYNLSLPSCFRIVVFSVTVFPADFGELFVEVIEYYVHVECYEERDLGLSVYL